jgi:hypothetical protein
MGEVIQGPWQRRGEPDQMSALDDEIERMAVALERLRDMHQRGEVVDLRAVLEAGRK